MPIANLVIIGPPKCGTTSIFDWLSKHPDTCASKIKETNYFLGRIVKDNKTANFEAHGLSRYEELFPDFNGQSVVFESSPGYLGSERALREFAMFDSPPQLIFIYRDPAERLYSEFRFSKYKTQSFQGSFEDYIGESLAKPKVEEGKIVTQINRWFEHYDHTKILLFHFDDLKKDAKGFMKSLCRKIDIDPEFYTSFFFDAKNTTVVRRSTGLHDFVNLFYKFFPDWARKIIVPIYRRINQTSLPETTEEEHALIHKLRVHYKDETWKNIRA